MDIVEELRNYDAEVFSGGLMIRAADEIERLREALAIAFDYADQSNVNEYAKCPECSEIENVVRAALKGKP